RVSDTEIRSSICRRKIEEIRVEALQFGEEMQRLMAPPPSFQPETASSFTALLELPANQAIKLLHTPATDATPSELPGEVWSDDLRIDHRSPYHLQSLNCNPTFPSDSALLERSARFSVFAAEMSPEKSSIPSISVPISNNVKQEPFDSDSNPNSSDPIAPINNPKSTKRKDREKKVSSVSITPKWVSRVFPLQGKGLTKKSRCSIGSDDGEKLPYVHVRVRRGQATDSHSLAERARREKINARMKLLQELVPGCNKISGTAMVLDEIINHVQSLQRQVEFLSMRLAAVDPRIDFSIDSVLAAESGSPEDSNFPSMVRPLMWPDGQVVNGYGKTQWESSLKWYHRHLSVINLKDLFSQINSKWNSEDELKLHPSGVLNVYIPYI
ncbi:hypothetical protein U1Q18_012841, partial [Sarracenia purpurea var. burkii]